MYCSTTVFHFLLPIQCHSLAELLSFCLNFELFWLQWTSYTLFNRDFADLESFSIKMALKFRVGQNGELELVDKK